MQYNSLLATYRDFLTRIHWNVFGTFTFPFSTGDQQADRTFRDFICLHERYYRAPIGWIRGDEKRLAQPSGLGKPPSGRHFHFALTSPAKLDPYTIEKKWKLIMGDRAGFFSKADIDRLQKRARSDVRIANDLNRIYGEFQNLCEGDLTFSGHAKVRQYSASGEKGFTASGQPTGGISYLLKSIASPDRIDTEHCEWAFSDNLFALFLPDSRKKVPNSRYRRSLRRMTTPRSSRTSNAASVPNIESRSCTWDELFEKRQ